MKFINYRCDSCMKYEEEEIFNDTEENIPSFLTDRFCPMCGGILRKFNLKNNQQRWKFFD